MDKTRDYAWVGVAVFVAVVLSMVILFIAGQENAAGLLWLAFCMWASMCWKHYYMPGVTVVRGLVGLVLASLFYEGGFYGWAVVIIMLVVMPLLIGTVLKLLVRRC